MAEVVVEIAGRTYRLGCGEGEEKRLQAYAEHMDQIATELQGAVRTGVPEGRLMVMVGMTLADRMAEEMVAQEAKMKALKSDLKAAREALAAQSDAGDLFSAEGDAAMAGRLNDIAERIERLTGMLS